MAGKANHPRPTVKLRGVRLRRPQLSGRSMMIAAMGLFLVVILASPLQTYLNRRDSVAASQRQQEQLKDHVAQLQQQTAQWNDPNYVERQARARLQYIRPGDTLYTVLNADGTPRPTPSSTTAQLARSGHQQSWNSTLWSSVQAADSAK
jgi:cell division protein FtsB